MFDETLIYQMVQRIPSGLSVWYPGWPQTFNGITGTRAIGCWKVADSSVAISTSTRREYGTRVRIELQTWSRTPEQRMALNNAIDAVFGEVFFRQSCTPLEETLPGGIKAFRSILIYSGVVNAETLEVYRP